jgi:hypothetical protein
MGQYWPESWREVTDQKDRRGLGIAIAIAEQEGRVAPKQKNININKNKNIKKSFSVRVSAAIPWTCAWS